MRRPSFRPSWHRRSGRRRAQQTADQRAQREAFEQTALAAILAASEIAARERDLTLGTPADDRLRYVGDSAALGLLRVAVRSRRQS